MKNLLAIHLLLAFPLANSVIAADPIQLFDGKSLDGWEVQGKQDKQRYWKVEDGMLVGENPDKQGSDLWTTQDFGDYELQLEFQSPSKYYDSGVYLRGHGHQVQIGISGSLQVDMTACIYAPQDKRGSYPAKSDKVAKVNQPGEWNHLRIVLQGKRIQTFLNGEPFVDYEAVVINPTGPVGLQLHAQHHMKMLFRNIQLKAL